MVQQTIYIIDIIILLEPIRECRILIEWPKKKKENKYLSNNRLPLS